MSEPAAEMWRAGHIVDGRYEVLEELGRGGMGVELFQSPDAWRRFADEAETWVSLGVHPHVCVCHYVATLDGIPRVFAEYVPGGSLRQWIEDRRLYQDDPSAGLARVLDVAIQVAWGLGHAHGRGLVHQDVKPANVLLGDDGTAKVADIALTRDGFVALSGSEDGTMRLWELDWELAAGGLADRDGSPMP
jgi:serine/threonine protein kinase